MGLATRAATRAGTRTAPGLRPETVQPMALSMMTAPRSAVGACSAPAWDAFMWRVLLLGLLALGLLALATPSWATGFGSGGSTSGGFASGGHIAGFGHPSGHRARFGEPPGIHFQDRIGRALPYHHMVGSRFTPEPITIASNRGHHHGHHGHRGHRGGFGATVVVPGNCHSYGYPYHYNYYNYNDYDAYYDPYADPGHYYQYAVPPPVAVVLPPRIIVRTPYYCGPCGVGFAGEAIFIEHLRSAHGIPANAIAASLVDVDGRSVFPGD